MRLVAEKRPRDPAAGLAARAQRLLALVQNHALSLVTGVTLWATRSRQAKKEPITIAVKLPENLANSGFMPSHNGLAQLINRHCI